MSDNLIRTRNSLNRHKTDEVDSQTRIPDIIDDRYFIAHLIILYCIWKTEQKALYMVTPTRIDTANSYLSAPPFLTEVRINLLSCHSLHSRLPQRYSTFSKIQSSCVCLSRLRNSNCVHNREKKYIKPAFR